MGKQKQSFQVNRAVVAFVLAVGVAATSTAAQMTASVSDWDWGDGICNLSWMSWAPFCEESGKKESAPVQEHTAATDQASNQATACVLYSVTDGLVTDSITVHQGGSVIKTPNCGDTITVQGNEFGVGHSDIKNDLRFTKTADGFTIEPQLLTTSAAEMILVKGFGKLYVQKGADLPFISAAAPDAPEPPSFAGGMPVTVTTTNVTTDTVTVSPTATTPAANAVTGIASAPAIDPMSEAAACAAGLPWVVCNKGPALINPDFSNLPAGLAGVSAGMPNFASTRPTVLTMPQGQIVWGDNAAENLQKLMQLQQQQFVVDDQGQQTVLTPGVTQGTYTWPMPTMQTVTVTNGTSASAGSTTTTVNPTILPTVEPPVTTLIIPKIGPLPIENPPPTIYPIGGSFVSAGHTAADEETSCYNNLDDDGDGDVDFADSDCVPEFGVNLCTNRHDDDHNGMTDAADGTCVERLCSNGRDDDRDGDIDMDDSDCRNGNFHSAAGPTTVPPITQPISNPSSAVPLSW